MSLLSFLGKVGKGIWKGIAYARPVAAAVGAVIPGPDPFEAVGNLLATAEGVGEIVKQQGGSKLDKLVLILPQVKEVIRNSEFFAKQELADEALFEQGAIELIGAEVKIYKAFKEPK